MSTDARGLERPEKPSGPLSGLFWEFDRRRHAATAHAMFEGHPEIDYRAVLEAYDRNEHPWMHGRRPHDLYERYGDALERLGFVIGLAIGAVLYGPARVAERVREWAAGRGGA